MSGGARTRVAMAGPRSWWRGRPPWLRTLVTLGAAVALPPAVAAGLIPLRGGTPNATIALVLATVVTLLAGTGTRLTAAAAAASAGIGFDIFHTRPYGSFSISRAQDIETTALLLAVGLVVGQIAAANRRHRDMATQSSYDLGRVHAVAEMVAAGEAVDQVVQAVANELADLLVLRSCRFDPSFAERPGPFIERYGDVSWGSIGWGFRTIGLPNHEVSLVIEHQGRPFGRYVLLGRAGVRLTEDQLLAAVALADQAGASLAGQVSRG